MRRLRSRGFTLLELLVALAVFAMVALMAYSGLRSVLHSKQITEQRAMRMQHLQSAMLMLERDLGQIALLRGIRDEYGDPQPPLRTADFGAITLEFTRAGWPNPTGMARSTLQRVAYGIKEDALWRYAWRVLDRSQQSTPDGIALLEGVREMQLRYRDDVGEWHEHWPPVGLEQALPAPSPTGLEVSLELEDLGVIRRLFPLLRPAPFVSTTPPPESGVGQGEETP